MLCGMEYIVSIYLPFALSSTLGVGSYVAHNGELIRERVTLVTSYHSLETSEALAIVIPLALAIKSEYGQEAIAIETEQGIDFI